MKILLFLGLIGLAFAHKQQIDLTAYDEVEYDKILQIKQGDTFEILLKENPTTGYIWQTFPWDLENAGLAKVLKVRSSKYEPDPKAKGAVGHGGTRIFQFQVIGEGTGKINFYYGRSWEITKLQEEGKSLDQFLQKSVPFSGISRKIKKVVDEEKKDDL